MQIKRIGPLSLAKVLGVLYTFLGLIIGGIVAVVTLLGAGLGIADPEVQGSMLGVVFGVGAVVFLPLLYGTMGVIGGLIVGALYNLVAGIVGGIEVDIA